jgi:hypothetical protein
VAEARSRAVLYYDTIGESPLTLGYESGTPTDPEAAHTLWNNAHTATLEDYGLPATPSALYHPEAERYILK